MNELLAAGVANGSGGGSDSWEDRDAWDEYDDDYDDNDEGDEEEEEDTILVGGPRRRMAGVRTSDASDLVVVTAANEPYFDRLRNLVGSLHHWEGEWILHQRAFGDRDHGSGNGSVPSVAVRPLRVLVYDLGLSEASRRDISSWRHIKLVRLPTADPLLLQEPYPEQ